MRLTKAFRKMWPVAMIVTGFVLTLMWMLVMLYWTARAFYGLYQLVF